MKTFQVISAATLSLLLGAPAVSFAQSRDQSGYDSGRVQRDSRPGGDRTGGSSVENGYRGRGSQSGTGDRQRGGATDRGGAPERSGEGYGRRSGGQGGSTYGGSRSEARPDSGSQGQYRRGGSRGSEAPQSGGRGGYDRPDSGRASGDRGDYGRGRTEGRDYSRQSDRRSEIDPTDRTRRDSTRGGGSWSTRDRGGYGYGRGSDDRGTYSRGDSARGGYDRPRQDSRDYSRRGDNRDFGRYASRGSYGGGRLDRNSWSRYRARSFASEHRSWRQRGGYRGYRIPDVYFHRYFGRSHWFRPGQLHFIVYDEAPCFEYDDYRFTLVDPYPEYWGDDWYDTDDCYVDYDDDGYYLYNRRYPDSPGVAININLRF